MLNRIKYLVLFVFVATLGLWFRPNLFGVDSYATLSFIRFGWSQTLGTQPVALLFFGLLPDSLLLFKLIMFSSIVFSLIPIWLLVRKFYDERSAYISIFFLLALSPIVLFMFGEFENEIFAFPLICWSIYWLLIGNYGKSIVSMSAALLFWKWVWYLTFFNFGGGQVVEQQLFAGLINLWLLFPFVFCIFLLKEKKVVVFGLISLVFVLINTKLMIFLLPFIALSIPNALNMLRRYDTIRFSLYIVAFICLFGWNIAFLMQQPTQSDVFFVSETIQLSKDTNLPIFNDSDFGYWLMANGYYTESNPGSWKKFDGNDPGIYLTSKDLNCLLIKEEKVIGRKKKNIFQCN